MKIIKRINKLRIFPYFLNGIFFTIFGPFLFWSLYSLGPIKSIVLTDLILHTLRFNSFKYIVFKRNKGYKVTLNSYLKTLFPITIFRLTLSFISYDYLEREIFIFLITSITILLGFVFSQINFKVKE